MLSRNNSLKVFVSLLVLVSLSCSVFGIPASSSPSGSNDQEGSVLISAASGGEVTLPDKTILKIPPGGLQSDTRVTITKVSDGSSPADAEEMTDTGSTYVIDLGTGRLQKPATLEIPFDSAHLPGGVDASQVFLSYFDDAAQAWVYAGGVVDTARSVVVLEITHASWWKPATWNWGAWIAVLDKVLSFKIVDLVGAVRLLTNDCPQSGNYVQVDSSQALNLVQGCVEVDDGQRPVLRVVNPKSFFYEIAPISGGNGYPAPTLLAPGDEVQFSASTSDVSPLIVEARMTQRSAWYLVLHMVITMLPGANQFGIEPTSVACFTERLADVSYFASAAESLLLNHDGAAAAESLSQFMLDGNAVRRFITVADDCNFGPAPTWSIEGIKQIGGAVSTIMSATDYIANYLAGNSSAQVSFAWKTSGTNTNTGSSYSDDFSSYPLGSPPAGWVERGETSISPVIVDAGGSGSQFRAVRFPEVPWQYWDKWLLRPGPVFSHSYEVTVKMEFLNDVADRAGITIAWNDSNWNRIDIQPNVYTDNIEFRVTYAGDIVANPQTTVLNAISIQANREYWLRAVAEDDGPGQGQVTVYWSSDGANFIPVLQAQGLASLDGWVGLSSAGPHLPAVIFDDFQAYMK
jgi:hypothetical protein